MIDSFNRCLNHRLSIDFGYVIVPRQIRQICSINLLHAIHRLPNGIDVLIDRFFPSLILNRSFMQIDNERIFFFF